MIRPHESTSNCTKASLEMCSQIIPEELIQFYLIGCPYAKSDKSASSAAQGLNLADRGWEGNSLAKLMRWIQSRFIDSNGNVQLGFFASDTVNETVRLLGLTDSSPCLSHPRATLQIKNKVTISENGKCTVKLGETYATCFFRHVRNSVAHGSFYLDPVGHIALFDSSSKPNTPTDKKKYSAAIITNLPFLFDLKQLVEAGADTYNEPESDSEFHKTDSYRVALQRDVVLSSLEDD